MTTDPAARNRLDTGRPLRLSWWWGARVVAARPARCEGPEQGSEFARFES